jgi:VanZ family protein
MRFSLLKAAQITAWLLAAVITVLSVVPPWLRPETGAPHDFEHFAIFFVTGVTFGFGYWRKLFVVTIALVVFAGMIEFIQLFVPGRHARLSDLIVDALALSVGAILGTIFAAQTLRQGV